MLNADKRQIGCGKPCAADHAGTCATGAKALLESASGRISLSGSAAPVMTAAIATVQ
jgi:hypothetical protein